MTEKEKESIERLNRDINTPLYGGDTTIVLKEDIETVLNLIDKQNKVIDEMAEWISNVCFYVDDYGNSCEVIQDSCYKDKDCKNCIKEYFIKKVEEK